MPRPTSAMQKLTRKIELKASGASGQQPEGQQRADHRPGRVQRAVHAEGGAELALGRRERDHRVARRGADALARRGR